MRRGKVCMSIDRSNGKQLMTKQFSVYRCRSGAALRFAANGRCKAKPDTEAAQLFYTILMEGRCTYLVSTCTGSQVRL
jgi:hypothetical protein